MAKKQTELSVLVDIRDFLKARFPHEPVLKPGAGIIIPDGGFLSLMHSSDRLEKLSDGWFRDRFLTMFYGKKLDWAPDNLEKHIKWQLAQDHAKSFCDQTYNARQPSVFEWETLRDRTKYNPAIIDAAKALNLKTDDWYWTGEDLAVAGSPSGAWCVGLENGVVDLNDKGSGICVRPVRVSQ